MAKSIPTYFPLKVIYNLDVQAEDSEMPGWKFEDIIGEYENAIGMSIDRTREEFISDFCVSGHHDKSSVNYVARLINLFAKNLVKSGYDPNRSPETFFTDIKDLIIYPLVIDKWSENKQVYQPDELFIKALEGTKNFSITKSDLEHLPVNTFFIDLTEIKSTNPYAGIFVDVTTNEDEVCIIVFLITYDETFFSHYLVCKEDDSGTLKGAFTELLSDDSFTSEATAEKINFRSKDFENFRLVSMDTEILETEIDRVELMRIVIQMLCYLISNEPDVADSPKTKSTYRRPIGKSQNRFNEVQIHDVGVRYGSSVRRLLKEEKKKVKEQEEHLVIHNPNKRKSPVPHFRCAHWQRFWVGKGRTQSIVKWLEPTFVGFNVNEKKDTDVVIHRVK